MITLRTCLSLNIDVCIYLTIDDVGAFGIVEKRY